MNNKEKHDFVFNYEFKLFTFPGFEIDGTSDEKGCDLFIYDTKNNLTVNIVYMKDKIYIRFDEDVFFKDFDFCENFEEKCYEIYKNYLNKNFACYYIHENENKND